MLWWKFRRASFRCSSQSQSNWCDSFVVVVSGRPRFRRKSFRFLSSLCSPWKRRVCAAVLVGRSMVLLDESNSWSNGIVFDIFLCSHSFKLRSKLKFSVLRPFQIWFAELELRDEKICSLQDWSSRCRRSTLFREACKTATQSSLHVRWSESLQSFTRSTSSTLSAKLKLKLKPAGITLLSIQFLRKVQWCWCLDSLPRHFCGIK